MRRPSYLERERDQATKRRQVNSPPAPKELTNRLADKILKSTDLIRESSELRKEVASKSLPPDNLPLHITSINLIYSQDLSQIMTTISWLRFKICLGCQPGPSQNGAQSSKSTKRVSTGSVATTKSSNQCVLIPYQGTKPSLTTGNGSLRTSLQCSSLWAPITDA